MAAETPSAAGEKSAYSDATDSLFAKNSASIIDSFVLQILSPGVDVDSALALIDKRKLRTALEGVCREVLAEAERNRNEEVKVRNGEGHSEVVTPTDYPVLQSYKIPIASASIDALFRDLSKLKKNIKSRDVYKFVQYNDVKATLVEVPVSSSEDRFMRNARDRKWIETIISSAVCIEGKSKEETRALGGRWTIKYISKKMLEEFVTLASELGMPVHSLKMDAEHAAAMWDESNTYPKMQRVMML